MSRELYQRIYARVIHIKNVDSVCHYKGPISEKNPRIYDGKHKREKLFWSYYHRRSPFHGHFLDVHQDQ